MHSCPSDKLKKQPDEPLSRAEKIIQNGGDPLMPEVDEPAYIVDYWQDIGMVGIGAMGIIPLSSQELMSWQQGKHIALNPWEFSIIREMSRAYCTQAHASEKPDCPPPYGNPEFEFDRAQVAKKVQNALKSFMTSKVQDGQ